MRIPCPPKAVGMAPNPSGSALRKASASRLNGGTRRRVERRGDALGEVRAEADDRSGDLREGDLHVFAGPARVFHFDLGVRPGDEELRMADVDPGDQAQVKALGV